MSRSVRKHAYYLSPAIPPTRPHRLSPAPRAGVNFSRGVNRARNIGHSRVRACLLLPPPLPYPDSRPRAPENKHGIEPFLQIQIAGREGRGRGERLGAPRTPSPSSFVPRETFSKKKKSDGPGLRREKKDKEKGREGKGERERERKNSHGSAIRCQNTKFDREE